MKTVEQQLAELKLKFAEMTDCARDILSELGEAYGHASACVNRFEDRVERVIKEANSNTKGEPHDSARKHNRRSD